MTQMRNNLELTKEHMRLGAITGIVLDADSSQLYNWFTEWGIAANAELVVNFSTLADGQFRKLCSKIIRQTARAAQGAWIQGRSTVAAIVGDEFWDSMIANVEVRQTYLNWTAAADLRGALGAPWEVFSWGGIDWINYRGTDDQPGGSAKVGVDPNKAKFFPRNAPEAFLEVHGPGEFFDTINLPGQDYYALTIPDEKRNAFVDVELYSYPLHVVTRPKMLNSARLA